MKRLLPIFAVILTAFILIAAVPFQKTEPPVTPAESSADGTEPSARPSEPDVSAPEESSGPESNPSEVSSIPLEFSEEPASDEPSEEPSADASSDAPSEESDASQETSKDDTSKSGSSDKDPGPLPVKQTIKTIQPEDLLEKLPVRDGMPETLLISELMPKNRDYPVGGEIWDWVEVYNNTGSAVTLSSYYLSDTAYELKKYRLPSVKLAANGYYVLRFGPEIDFSISADGDETLILSNGTKAVSILKVPKTKKNISILQDGSTTTVPTPGRANCPNPGYEPTRELIISEVIPLNSKIPYDDGEMYGLIELQNTYSDRELSLNGYYLSVSGADWKQFPLPDVTLPPKGFAVFYAVPENKAAGNTMCLPIPLSGGARTLFLSDSGGILTDFLYVPEQINDASYGRYNGNSVYFLHSSIGSENTVGYPLPSMPVESSVPAGVYGKSLTVTLSSPDKGKIYYTTDGSVPTTKSTLYSGPITISKTTSVRAINVRSGQKPSAAVTFAYMINLPDLTADIMQVSMNPSDFSYIYKNYLQHTEKPANVTFFHDGKAEFSVDCGIKINGKSSRKLAKKSFQLKFRIEYGTNKLKYKMFEKLDINEFKALVIRSGSAGAAAFRYFINDEFATSIMAEAETQVLARSYRPVNLYINGEYYGIYFIREKVNDDFVASHLGVSSDSVDIVKGMKTLEHGYSKGDWDEIWTFAQKHSMKTEAEYEWMDERICLTDVMDFYIMQSWCCNTDAGNVRVFRSRELDGKWHWLFFDLDQTFAMATKTYGLGAVASMLGSCNTTNSEGCSDYNCIFYKLFQNERFRTEFRERLQWWLDGPLSVESLQARLDHMMDQIEHDMQYSIPRWAVINDGVMGYHKSMDAWLGKIAQLKEYWLSEKRHENFLNEYETYIEKFAKK
ncbi:MAG: CotH kinase family protein [Clostridia bacterium]|nr:CotH kinase family protein [Clostridia bacterium]